MSFLSLRIAEQNSCTEIVSKREKYQRVGRGAEGNLISNLILLKMKILNQFNGLYSMKDVKIIENIVALMTL